MDAAMQATAEFKSLVAAHQRLAKKYGDRRRWAKSIGGMDFEELQTTQAYTTPCFEPTLVQNVSYPNRDTTQYWSRSLEDYEYATNDNMGDKALFTSESRDAAGVNHMISLQLASMEYARLLMTLNPLTPYHGTQIQTESFPSHLRPDNYPIGRGINKRRSDEKVDVQKPIPVKRARLVWTKDLHQKFVEAVDQIGIDKAVPKAILEAMGIEGLTRENVASHLQKYRLQKGPGSSTKKSSHGVIRKLDTSTGRGSHEGESDSTASMADDMGHSYLNGEGNDRF